MVLYRKLAHKFSSMKHNETFNSAISNIKYPLKDLVLGTSIRISILQLIREDYPDFDKNSSISVSELNIYREKYISKYLQTEIRALSAIEKDVVNLTGGVLSLDGQQKIEFSLAGKNPIELGQKLADQLIAAGASELLKEIRRQIAL